MGVPSTLVLRALLGGSASSSAGAGLLAALGLTALGLAALGLAALGLAALGAALALAADLGAARVLAADLGAAALGLTALGSSSGSSAFFAAPALQQQGKSCDPSFESS